MNESAKRYIVNELQGLAWYCHKRDRSYAIMKTQYHKFKGALRAFYAIGAIDRKYYEQMLRNGRNLFWKYRTVKEMKKYEKQGRDDPDAR